MSFLKIFSPKTWTRSELSRFWLTLGVTSLFVSGFFALFISAAKIPGLAQFLTQIDFFRRALVVHVDLSVVVWFMCMPVALFHFLHQSSPAKLWMRFFFSFALGGVLLFAIAGFLPEGKPLLSNYVPVTTHPLYLAGLLLFMFAVASNYFSAFSMSSNHAYEKLNISADWVRCLQFGVRLGSIYFLLGLLALLCSTQNLPVTYKDEIFYEIGVWGYGHLQQFSNLIFMIIAWIILLKSWNKNFLFSRQVLFWTFVGLSLPLLAMPVLFGYSPMDFIYRRGFTELMRWGTFPPCLFLLVFIVHSLVKQKSNLRFSDYRFLTFAASAGLLLIGFVFGAFIRGPDLRLPGHYHATIGAVTLSFMGLAFVLLNAICENAAEKKERLRRWSVILYGLGQLGFSGGMFISGSFGMGRKTYGVEQHFQNFGQEFGMIVMAVGGVLALIGGFTFGMASLPFIFKPSKV